ncbi:MAG TPA: phosphopentomutase [Candidatus Limnocylindrales bacterium]|nr:phosphopentomutase [Candidatus Limnocylindrales bacterium]
MSRAILLVIDGLGVGVMADAVSTRPRDAGANTLLHVIAAAERGGRPLEVPNLARLGLLEIAGAVPLSGVRFPGAAAGRTALGYPGADTYLGHQTIFGSDLRDLQLRPFREVGPDVARRLAADGHVVEPLSESVLLIDGTMILGDSLEADPGLNFNVTGSLDITSFEKILAVAEAVREVVSVARVIAVGGSGLDRQGLVDCVRPGSDGVAGIDTPKTGFYLKPGLRVVHLARPIDTARQLPTLCRQAGLPVTLIGKMAEVVQCEGAAMKPAVATAGVVERWRDALAGQPDGLIAVNAQETDLAGHQQDADLYGRILRQLDEAVGTVLRGLRPGDLFMVAGDHGNDPTIGHPFHTREYVPVLMYRPGGAGFRRLGERRSLADVGATLASHLGIDPGRLEQGEPIVSA